MAEKWLKKELVKAKEYPFPFECRIERFIETDLIDENGENQSQETFMVYVHLEDDEHRKEMVAILFNDRTPFFPPHISFMNKDLVHPFIRNNQLLIKDWFAGETLVSLILNIYCIWQESQNIK